jgi:hypothetical protein
VGSILWLGVPDWLSLPLYALLGDWSEEIALVLVCHARGLAMPFAGELGLELGLGLGPPGFICGNAQPHTTQNFLRVKRRTTRMHCGYT